MVDFVERPIGQPTEDATMLRSFLLLTAMSAIVAWMLISSPFGCAAAIRLPLTQAVCTVAGF